MENPNSPKIPLAEAIAEVADELIERQETRQDAVEQAIAEVADELLRRTGEKERIQPPVGGPLRPADPTITEEDIDRANARFDDLLPGFAGLLEAKVQGRKAKGPEVNADKFTWKEGDLVIESGKGSAASGNWAHTSFNRIDVGRGGSDRSGTFGGGLVSLGLDKDSTPEERREASARLREDREGAVAMRLGQARQLMQTPYHDPYPTREWAQEHYTEWNKGLTVEEEAALKKYASSSYYDVNSYLRYGAEGMSTGTRLTAEAMLGPLDSALAKTSMAEDVLVTRGIAAGYAENIFALEPGQTFVDKGFTSTSAVQSFAWGEKTLRILVPRGAQAAYLGSGTGKVLGVPAEYELLLGRGTRFQVMMKTREEVAGSERDVMYVAVVNQGNKAFLDKGSAASGNWLHTSFNRMDVGRGGSDPSGTGGGGLAIMGLDKDSTPEERRQASERIRQARDQYGVGKPPAGDNPTKVRMSGLHAEVIGWPPTTESQVAAIEKIVTDISARSGVPKKDVQTVMQVWALTSTGKDATALTTQESVAKELGVPMSAFTRGRKRELETERESRIQQYMADGMGREQAENYLQIKYRPRVSPEATQKVARAMYEATQEELRVMGYKAGDMVRLYRGVSLEKGGPSDNFAVGDTVPIIGNAIGSWTTTPFMASGFAKPAQDWNGVVFALDVPVERIFSTFATGMGTSYENEIVVLGGFPGDMAQVETVRPATTKSLNGLIGRAKSLFDNLLRKHGELDLG